MVAVLEVALAFACSLVAVLAFASFQIPQIGSFGIAVDTVG